MAHRLLAAYPSADGRFDELLDEAQKPRPHWSALFAELAGTPAGRIRERQSAIERQIRESGITYNVYADPHGLDRPWDLDVLPLVVPDDEWRLIADAIAQRAELLNRILVDLYGEQRLLAEGLIPPALIYGQSGFWRPARGMRVPGARHLFIYAADLARSPDGQWWVMADRTQAPSGAGYALENRLIVARIFPALFRSLNVHHLAGFFATLRDSLMSFAPSGDGAPLTVVWTPGPYNETFFEHSLLSRYLGYPLVEGGDLKVRDGRVWLKTLNGLQRVHAIVRRQDDGYCDPLELRADSALGVAGLTACARSGSVLIANALGSGVLESGALLGFLPRLCDRLIGAPLKLPSIATWWCGEPAAYEDAFKHADSLVFKSADPAFSFDPVFGADLTAASLDDLKARMSAAPERFIAQEWVRVSQAPVLVRDHKRLGARGVGLRVFAVATANGYAVMPGGLSRVAAAVGDPRILSMQRGGGSKDTWVLSEQPIDKAFSLLPDRVTAAQLVRSGAALPSRIAEHLFWFGRYAERCEDEARLLRLALQTLLRSRRGDGARPVLALTEAFGLKIDAIDPEPGLLAAATIENEAVDLVANLRALWRVAFTLRERISIDNWRAINRLLHDPAVGADCSLAETVDWLDRTIVALMTLSGFHLDGMTRDTGWRFLSIGRRLERLTFLCLALMVGTRESRDADLTWLLELADSVITYRSRYMSRPEWLPLLDLLLLDGANPRSVMFQARGIHGYLAKLEAELGDCGARLFADLVERLEALDLEHDLRPDSERLNDLIGDIRGSAFQLSDRLLHQFFAHAD